MEEEEEEGVGILAEERDLTERGESTALRTGEFFFNFSLLQMWFEDC